MDQTASPFLMTVPCNPSHPFARACTANSHRAVDSRGRSCTVQRLYQNTKPRTPMGRVFINRSCGFPRTVIRPSYGLATVKFDGDSMTTTVPFEELTFGKHPAGYNQPGAETFAAVRVRPRGLLRTVAVLRIEPIRGRQRLATMID